MYLRGLGTAVPSHRFTQTECWTALQQAPQFSQLNARSRALLRKVLSGENGIATRHMVMANWKEAFVLTPGVLHDRFARHAPALATQAAERAIATARLDLVIAQRKAGRWDLAREEAEDVFELPGLPEALRDKVR